MMSVIYEPKGAAGEYAELAVNLFTGCRHGCKYCYVPAVLHIKAEVFHSEVRARAMILTKLEKEAAKMAGDKREILLCFTCDPYPEDAELREVTREALKILGRNNLKATVLTKGGTRAMGDFELMEKYGFSFGTSLVWNNDDDREKWEPLAVSVGVRKHAIKSAGGLWTWVSLEPVMDPEQALEVIKDMHRWVDHWKVGKINWRPGMDKEIRDIELAIDWGKFYKDVTGLLLDLEADYYIKESLRKFQ